MKTSPHWSEVLKIEKTATREQVGAAFYKQLMTTDDVRQRLKIRIAYMQASADISAGDGQLNMELKK